jgi:hypothetical protein
MVSKLSAIVSQLDRISGLGGTTRSLPGVLSLGHELGRRLQRLLIVLVGICCHADELGAERHEARGSCEQRARAGEARPPPSRIFGIFVSEFCFATSAAGLWLRECCCSSLHAAVVDALAPGRLARSTSSPTSTGAARRQARSPCSRKGFCPPPCRRSLPMTVRSMGSVRQGSKQRRDNRDKPTSQ